MSSFLIILVFTGPVLLFGLVKTGVHLIVPLIGCVIAAGVGIAMFIWGMNNTSLADHHSGDLLPQAVYGIMIVISAAFAGVLLAVVVIARWFSGEYKGEEKP